MRPSATIIGGSMAGLFSATSLSKKGWDISVHEKVPVPLSGRGAGIATYDELADLVFKATNNNNVLGTTAKSRVSLDILNFTPSFLSKETEATLSTEFKNNFKSISNFF